MNDTKAGARHSASDMQHLGHIVSHARQIVDHAAALGAAMDELPEADGIAEPDADDMTKAQQIAPGAMSPVEGKALADVVLPYILDALKVGIQTARVASPTEADEPADETDDTTKATNGDDPLKAWADEWKEYATKV